jgi:inorganic triphosphatase YgiF
MARRCRRCSDFAGQLGARVALTPAVLSKAERGYRLHGGMSADAGKGELPSCLLPR